MAVTTLSTTLLLGGGVTSKPKAVKMPAGTVLRRGAVAVEAASRRVPATPVPAKVVKKKAGGRGKVIKKKAGGPGHSKDAAEDGGFLAFVANKAKQAIAVVVKTKLHPRLQKEQLDLVSNLDELVDYNDEGVECEESRLKVLHALRFIAASKGMSKLCFREPPPRRAPATTVPPPAVQRKFPKVFFADGSAVTNDFGPDGKNEAKMRAAVEESFKEVKAAVLYHTVARLM